MELLTYSFVATLAALASVANADAPSLMDALKKVPELSSMQGLLESQIPDFLDKLNKYNADDNPITILAPSNEAFDKIPYYDVIGPAWGSNNLSLIESIMDYHAVPGLYTSEKLNSTFMYLETLLDDANANVEGGQRIGAVLQPGDEPQVVFVSGGSNRAIVSKADIEFSGGVIHMLESFNIIPSGFVYTASKYNLALQSASITSFIGALYSTQNDTLQKYLNATKDVTVFVPTNLAMETVSGALESMSEADLMQLLSYHIVVSPDDPAYSTSFSNGTTLQTLQGSQLDVSYSSNSYFVENARIITSDLILSNGVMHVIDNVLSPNATSASPDASQATQSPNLATDGSFNSSAAPFTTYLPNIPSTVVDGSVPADATGAAGDATYYPGQNQGSTTPAYPTSSTSAATTTSALHAEWRPMAFAVTVVGLTVGVWSLPFW